MIASYMVRKIINCVKWLGIHVNNKVQMFTQLIAELVFINVKLLKVFSPSTIPMICITTNSTTFMNLLDVTHNNALVENFIQLRHWIETHLLAHGSLCIGVHGYIEK
jgi:hypothetical protein